MLGPRENEYLAPIVMTDQPRQQTALLVATHRMHPLRDRVDRRVARRDFDRLRPIEQLVREGLDLVRECRREQQVLALPWQQREDALHVRQEPHVEHPIRLVEDEDFDPREIDVALLQVIEQAARCSNQDVDPASELRRLRRQPDAAEDRSRGELEMFAVGSDRRFHLRSELARGRDDQRPQRLARAGVRRGLARQPLQHRQHEARGLAGAGLSAGQQIAAGEHRGDRPRLNRSGDGIALIGDRAQQRVGQP